MLYIFYKKTPPGKPSGDSYDLVIAEIIVFVVLVEVVILLSSRVGICKDCIRCESVRVNLDFGCVIFFHISHPRYAITEAVWALEII